MYKINDVVMHKSFGIYTIVEIRTIVLKDKPQRKYYVMHSLYDEDSTALVPVDSADALLREPLSSQEIKKLMNSISDQIVEWDNSTRARKENFANFIKEGNPYLLVGILRILRYMDEERKKVGKRINDADSRQEKQAKKMLSEEIAYSLNMSIDKALSLLNEELDKNQFNG